MTSMNAAKAHITRSRLDNRNHRGGACVYFELKLSRSYVSQGHVLRRFTIRQFVIPSLTSSHRSCTNEQFRREEHCIGGLARLLNAV